MADRYIMTPVQALEWMLMQARAGKVRAVACAYITPLGEPQRCYSFEDSDVRLLMHSVDMLRTHLNVSAD